MDAASEALGELQFIATEFGVNDRGQEEHFANGLRERADYWEKCTWWKKEDA